jgi:hypothetical protein
VRPRVTPRSIPYDPVDWVDGVTPVNAENLNQMEDQIEALSAAAGEAGGAIEYENAWAPGTPYTPGDVVIHNGREYLSVNPSTAQEPVPLGAGASGTPVIGMGTSLPASPFDGQEFILTDSLTAPTYTWRLRYVAAKATNKWVFIGGSPAVATNDASIAIAAVGWQAIPGGPAFVTPVAGAYEIEASTLAHLSTGTGTVACGASINALDPLYYDQQTGVGTEALGLRAPPHTYSVGAASVIGMKVYHSANTVSALHMVLRVIPVAVGG